MENYKFGDEIFCFGNGSKKTFKFISIYGKYINGCYASDDEIHTDICIMIGKILGKNSDTYKRFLYNDLKIKGKTIKEKRTNLLGQMVVLCEKVKTEYENVISGEKKFAEMLKKVSATFGDLPEPNSIFDKNIKILNEEHAIYGDFNEFKIIYKNYLIGKYSDELELQKDIKKILTLYLEENYDVVEKYELKLFGIGPISRSRDLRDKLDEICKKIKPLAELNAAHLKLSKIIWDLNSIDLKCAKKDINRINVKLEKLKFKIINAKKKISKELCPIFGN